MKYLKFIKIRKSKEEIEIEMGVKNYRLITCNIILFEEIFIYTSIFLKIQSIKLSIKISFHFMTFITFNNKMKHALTSFFYLLNL